MHLAIQITWLFKCAWLFKLHGYSNNMAIQMYMAIQMIGLFKWQGYSKASVHSDTNKGGPFLALAMASSLQVTAAVARNLHAN